MNQDSPSISSMTGGAQIVHMPWTLTRATRGPRSASRLKRKPVSDRALPVHPTVLVAGFWFCTLALLAVGLGPKVKFVWPAVAVICGWFLIQRAPRQYVSFVWLLWFFTPCVRRIVDFGSWSPFNPCMLAPPLVTALACFQLLRRSYVWRRAEVTPFVLIIAGVLYAFGRGIGVNGFLSPAYDLLEWFVPPAFAAYLLVYRDQLGSLEKTLQTTFSIGVLVMGLYGLAQFLSPSPWDVYWMQSVPMASIGHPLPYQVRVFSTMNSPGPFALIMMAGLLLVPSGRGVFRWLAVGPGVVSLLLSLVRASWGGYVAGLVMIAAKATGRLRGRLIAIIVVLAIVGLPLLTIGPVADTVSKRLDSFESMQDDSSFNIRMEMYATCAGICFLNAPGSGLGSTGTSSKLQSANGQLGATANFDSGLLNIPFVLGWPGTLLYAGGVLSLLTRMFRHPAIGRDLFLCSCAGIAIGALGQMVFINTLIGVQGMVFWCFLGLCLAGANPQRRAIAAGDFAGKGRGIVAI